MTYTTKRLATIPTGNVKVRIYENGDIDLISYTTVVITVRSGELFVHGLFSATTRKHIGAFMREYTKGDYYTAKQAYSENKLYNIYTGEMVD